MSVPRINAFLGVLAGSFFLWGSAECSNSAPQALDDLAGNGGQLVYVDVLANDTDSDGERLSLSNLGGTCQSVGTVSVESDLVRFEPSPPVPSDCTVTYTATDEHGLSDTATLIFTEVSLSLIFADDFESGATDAWSECIGCLN